MDVEIRTSSRGSVQTCRGLGLQLLFGVSIAHIRGGRVKHLCEMLVMFEFGEIPTLSQKASYKIFFFWRERLYLFFREGSKGRRGRGGGL